MLILRHSQRTSRALVALFFLALAGIGLLTVQDYGAPYDELVEMQIFEANIKEYALRFGAPAADDFYAGLNVTRISENRERDHGICAYYPLAIALPSLYGQTRDYSKAWSVLTFLWFILGCLSLYGVFRELDLSRPSSALGTLLLYLSPRFFAESHYNNKDVILLCFVLLTLWMGLRLLKKPGLLRGLLFSFAGAMATNTKIAGGLPWGLIGLAMILLLTFNRRWSRKMAGVALATVAGYVAFYLMLTPAAWTDPIAFFQYLLTNATKFSRFGGIVVFRGAQFYDLGGKTPLPWYYLPYYVLVTVPLYTLLLSVIGQGVALRKWITRPKDCVRTEKPLFLAVVTLSWSVPLLFAVLSKPLLYNGWRHFYFIYAGLVILAGYGLNFIFQAVRRRRTLRWIAALAMSVCLCFTAYGLYRNHPLQYAYFNPLQPRDARHTMDLDYWNVSDSAAFLRLYELKKNQPGKLRVGCYFNDIKIGAFKLPDAVYDRLIISANADEPYLYYNSTYAYIYWAEEPPPGYHTLFTLESYGNTVGVMYERDDVSSVTAT